MTQAQLVKKVALRSGYSPILVENIIDFMSIEVYESLKRGEQASFLKLGHFKAIELKAKNHVMVSFQPKDLLSKIINDKKILRKQ